MNYFAYLINVITVYTIQDGLNSPLEVRRCQNCPGVDQLPHSIYVSTYAFARPYIKEQI